MTLNRIFLPELKTYWNKTEHPSFDDFLINDFSSSKIGLEKVTRFTWTSHVKKNEVILKNLDLRNDLKKRYKNNLKALLISVGIGVGGVILGAITELVPLITVSILVPSVHILGYLVQGHDFSRKIVIRKNKASDISVGGNALSFEYNDVHLLEKDGTYIFYFKSGGKVPEKSFFLWGKKPSNDEMEDFLSALRIVNKNLNAHVAN